MKYILIIGDGMADNPVPELDGRTPLEAADKPHIDALASQALLGSVLTVPRQLPPGSDTAILSIFGCDPTRYYTGRSPLEAAGSGVSLQPGDVSYRCNMVALSDGDGLFEDKTILSHSAGSIDGETAIALITWLFDDPEFAAAAAGLHVRVSPQPSFGCARKFSQQTSTSPSTTTAGTGSIPPPHSSPAVFSNRSEPSPVISTQSKPSKQL